MGADPRARHGPGSLIFPVPGLPLRTPLNAASGLSIKVLTVVRPAALSHLCAQEQSPQPPTTMRASFLISAVALLLVGAAAPALALKTGDCYVGESPMNKTRDAGGTAGTRCTGCHSWKPYAAQGAPCRARRLPATAVASGSFPPLLPGFHPLARYHKET
jgi:hypothetical protein